MARKIRELKRKNASPRMQTGLSLQPALSAWEVCGAAAPPPSDWLICASARDGASRILMYFSGIVSLEPSPEPLQLEESGIGCAITWDRGNLLRPAARCSPHEKWRGTAGVLHRANRAPPGRTADSNKFTEITWPGTYLAQPQVFTAPTRATSLLRSPASHEDRWHPRGCAPPPTGQRSPARRLCS